MLRRRSDLPLANDPTSRFLPWLVALMVYLTAIALAGAFILGGLIGRWDRDVSGTLTVQVAPAQGDAQRAAAATRQRVEAAVALLIKTPGVTAARPLEDRQITALLEPWLGDTALLADLPLPRLIDVTLDPNLGVDLERLAGDLARAVPGASLDDHRVWLSKLVMLSRTIEWIAIAVVCLIGAVTSATVVYATRTGMAVHREVIAVLHMIGAQDDYIARQFADHALALGLKGGLVGLLLAGPSLMALDWGAQRLEGGFLIDLSLPLGGWVAVLALPPAAGLLAMATARLTVLRVVARMP